MLPIMKLPPMSEPEVRELLQKSLVAKLATLNKDGTLRITALWFESREGIIALNTHEKTTHVNNLKRNPNASMLIDSVDWPYKAIHMIGRATVDPRPSTKEEIGKMYTRYLGDYEKAVAYGEKLISWGKRVSIHFTPKDVITYDFTKSQ